MQIKAKNIHSGVITQVSKHQNYFADNSPAYFVNGSCEPITRREFLKTYKVVSNEKS